MVKEQLCAERRDTAGMASGNVELVRSIYEAWARGDSRPVRWADPGIEYVIADGPNQAAGEGSTRWLTRSASS